MKHIISLELQMLQIDFHKYQINNYQLAECETSCVMNIYMSMCIL